MILRPGTVPAPFDIAGPLPTGTTVLEASAGTGKTWTIAALVARYVAEGTPLRELLVVTFGRAATQELRERVRERLTAVERHLAETISTSPTDRGEPGDALLAALVAGQDEAELRLRHQRVREAIGAFDDATIATIHQFCQLVLRSLGVAGDSDSAATLVEDLGTLRDEVVDDGYLAAYAVGPEPPFDHAAARQIGERVTEDPFAELGPDDAADSRTGARRAFGCAVRREFARRKRMLGVLGYDDLLADLAEALERPDSPARERMRARWSVVLVDEFQDTDPVQWQVFDRAFHGHRTMVLIGDPKQAIYAFRGGDVDTYVAARASAAQVATLTLNRRSDGPLVAALSAALAGMPLGHNDIVVPPAAASRADWQLAGAPVMKPWRLRVGTRERLGADGSSLPQVGTARPAIATDAAEDIARLVGSGATLAGRPLTPGDIAVLASTGHQLALVRDALRRAGIAAVLGTDESVFASPSALAWLTLLEAMEAPNRTRRVRAAALTPFIGAGVGDLDQRAELTEEVADRMRRWGELLALRGIPAVLEAATIGGLAARVLATPGGERELTDVRHLGELLHQGAMEGGLGLSALTAWLRRQVTEPQARGVTGRSRRLESDAAAVQLSTIHGSKGLQYPVVYAPFLSDRHIPEAEFPRYHDTDGVRRLDVGGAPSGHVRERAAAEDAGESLRLLYVALTRAQSQLVTWWAPMTTTTGSPLHRMLFGREPGGGAPPPDTVPVPGRIAVIEQRIGDWMRAGGPAPEWMDPAPGSRPGPARQEGPRTELVVRRFERPVDTDWRRTSYSALTRVTETATTGDASVGGPAPTSEPEVAGKDDEAPGAVILAGTSGAATAGGAAAVPSPMASLPVGATFGSLVHAVLEEANLQAPDLRAELRAQIDAQQLRWPVELPRTTLTDALVAAVTTPLGRLVPGTTLATIRARDRLCEMDFELPLAGGDHPSQTRVRLGDIAPLLRAHLDVADPLRRYAEELDAPELGDQSLRGYLTGSVDLAFRAGGLHYVVDYKTNWLGPPDADLTAADYTPERLAAAMQHSSYPLQALLYCVVLHRFLRWRLPGYRPGRHLGGVLYLYLRGMCGPDTPVIDGDPTGVFSWRPPPALVEALSDLLDGRRP